MKEQVLLEPQSLPHRAWGSEGRRAVGPIRDLGLESLPLNISTVPGLQGMAYYSQHYPPPLAHLHLLHEQAAPWASCTLEVSNLSPSYTPKEAISLHKRMAYVLPSSVFSFNQSHFLNKFSILNNNIYEVQF